MRNQYSAIEDFYDAMAAAEMRMKMLKERARLLGLWPVEVLPPISRAKHMLRFFPVGFT